MLFHGGSGGFNGDNWHNNQGNIQPEHDGFIGGATIGNKIVPPNIPMSLREPSRSLYCDQWPLSMQGESGLGEKSPLSLGSASKQSFFTTPPPISLLSELLEAHKQLLCKRTP